MANINELKENVYLDYRSSLHAVKNGGRITLAMKHSVWDKVAAKYGITKVQAGSVTSHFDGIYDLTYGNPSSYEEELAYIKDFNYISISNISHLIHQFCPRCKNAEKFIDRYDDIPPGDKKNKVMVRPDPYQVEVFDKWEPLLSCFSCHREIYQDV